MLLYTPYNTIRRTYFMFKRSIYTTFSLWIIIALAIVIWFYVLGARTLVPTDEGRYAEMAREMFSTNDWITPRLNGIKYFEKPPLQTWMNALTFLFFGLGEWQARLWTGLTGLLSIFLVGYTATRLYDKKAGITASLILGSTFFWIALSHINTLDMGFSSMLTLSLCAMLVGQSEKQSPRTQCHAMLLCWAGMAMATLSKGLAGIVLPGAVLFLYTCITRDWLILTRLHLGKGIAIFLGLTAPWFMLVSHANPEFLSFFFIHEHWERYTSNVHDRTGAWYYFIPYLLIGIFPWLGLFIPSIQSGIKRQSTLFQPTQLLTIWILFIFGFFSLSHSKLPAYILPIFPALACLMSAHLHQTSVSSALKGIRTCAMIMGLTGVAGIIAWLFSNTITGYFLASEPTPLILQPLYKASLPYILIVSLLFFITGLCAYCIRFSHYHYRLWLLAGAAFLGSHLLLLSYEPWGRYRAGTLYLETINAERTNTTPLYAVGRYEQVLPFYLRHTFILVEFPDEMAFGLKQSPYLWLPKRETFIQTWETHQRLHRPALAIIDPEIYKVLQSQGLLMRVIVQDPKRVIVSSE